MSAVSLDRKLLAGLREMNRRRARLVHLLRRVHALGPRPSVEMQLEFAARLGGLALLEEMAAAYAKKLHPDVLRATGGDRFAASPIRLVEGRR